MRQGVTFVFILVSLFMPNLISGSALAARDQCAPLFKSARAKKSDSVLTLGKRVTVELLPGENDPYLFELIVIGRYGDRVALVNPNNFYDIHFMTPKYLEAQGYTTRLRDFPRMTPQMGPTCLPFAIAYLQNIVGDTKRLSAIPDVFRAGFMSLSMTFNPLMQFSEKVQLENAEAAMRASGIAFNRTKKLDDLTAHLANGGIALVGLFVGQREGSYSEIPLKNSSRVKVSTPQGRVLGAHAMVAIGLVETGEHGGGYSTKLYILLDPASGQIVAAREYDLRTEHIESFLIVEPASP